MRYKVVTDTNKSDFEDNVEHYLNNGYVLYGSISVVPISGNRAWYTQTLIKEEKEDNETMLTENQVNDFLKSHCTEGIIEIGVDKND